MGIVGVIANPVAGKDIRRLATAASHTSDSVKIGIIRRAVISAVEAGAERVVVSQDPHRLATRATADLHLPVDVLDSPLTGSRLDTRRAAAEMAALGVGVVVVLGGDGTCRDVAIGWPDAVLVAISTGTNNVFPSAWDATAAGCAAGFVAAGSVPLDDVGHRAKRVRFHVEDAARELDLSAVTATATASAVSDGMALVDVALVDTRFVGTRAVLDPGTVRAVIAAIATPASTGLSSIAGRVHPVDRGAPGGVLVRLGDGGRPLRVPLSPGTFTTVEVTEVRPLACGDRVVLGRTGILAMDGERDRPVHEGELVTAWIDDHGPLVVDVEAVLARAASLGLFEPRARDAGAAAHHAGVKGD